MKNVKCKECNCDIYAEYSPIESLNEREKILNIFKKKKMVVKYYSELEQNPTDNCNIAVYLTCENGHTKQYFCKIKTK